MFAPDEGAKQSQEEVIGEELNADPAESCSDKERKMSGFSESETGGLGGIQSGELAIQLSHQHPCLPCFPLYYLLLPNAYCLFYILRENNFGWVARSGHIFDSALTYENARTQDRR